MTEWSHLLVSVCVGLVVVCASPWVLSRLGRRYGLDHACVIRPPVRKFEGFDEAIRTRSSLRRIHVDALRRDSARLAAGGRERDAGRLVSFGRN